MIFFLIFGVDLRRQQSIKSEDGIRGAAFLEAGMIGYGVAATCFAGLGDHAGRAPRVGRAQARPRDAAARPRPTSLAVLASTFVVFLIEAALIIVLGRMLFSVAVPERLLSLLVVLVDRRGVRSRRWASASRALVRSAEGSSAVINAVYLPMAIISGTFFSPDALPAVPARDRRRPAADALHRADARRDGAEPARLVRRAARSRVVLVWGVVGLVGALRGFRWQPQEG